MIMLRLALAIVRFWTALYTNGMPDALRQARRAEIESDLWESQHDRRLQSDASVASQMLLRVVRGVPNDVLWRVELMDLRSRRRRTGMWVTATAIALLAIALWIGPAMTPAELPVPPNQMHFVAGPGPVVPPPPPPPPPPPLSWNAAGGSVSDAPPPPPPQ